MEQIVWAALEGLPEIANVNVATAEDGIDNLALVKFDVEFTQLAELIRSLGIERQLRPGYRPMPPRSDTDPPWWTPYDAEEFWGTQGLTSGLGREVVVHNSEPLSIVFLRTYQI